MSRIRTLAAAVLVAVAAGLAVATPAAAHDQLIGADPAPDSRLESAPAQITLEFNANVMETGALIDVVDETGRDWATAEPEIVERTVTVSLDEGMPVAGYEVRWRVVSSDGHPISGIIPFTVGDAAPYERPAEDTPSDAADPSEAPSPGDTDTAQSAEDDGGTLRTVVIGVGGAVIAVAVLALILFLRRPRPHGRDGTGDDAR